MTIRAGGRPRNGSQAHPAYPEGRGPRNGPNGRNGPSGRNGLNGRPPRRGSGGIVRFLLFTLVLAGLVLTALVTVARPLIAGVVVDIADANPGALRLPFVASIVRDDLGSALTDPAGSDPTEVEFVVDSGDTPATLAPRLKKEGLIVSERVFLFAAFEQNLGDRLQSGRYRLRRNMTPAEVATGLVENRIVVETVSVTFREGLRIEQMTAKLQTVESGVDPKEFYDLATNPPEDVLADFPWLPKGIDSLEGFLYPSTYSLRTDPGGPTTAADLVRMMLDEFAEEVGEERLQVAESRGLSFMEVLTLASIVEREAQLDEERPIIAGVYQNRLDRLSGIAPVLAADPTVFYALDTVKLRDEVPFEEWKGFTFWTPPGVSLNRVELPEDLAGYQTYRVAGLPPGPICSPSVASIDAALEPDTESGYLFFLAIPDGGGKHAFAKTEAEHDDNRRKYGYL